MRSAKSRSGRLDSSAPTVPLWPAMDTSANAPPAERPAFDVEALLAPLRGGKRLFVFTHDNPDPDAIAAAWLLARIGEHAGLRSRIIYGGHLGRAENRTMVRVLQIPLQPVERVAARPRSTDRFALVDAQPGTGNNSFPPRWPCHVVLDHHTLRRGASAGLLDVRLDQGCTATLALGYFEAAGLTVDSRLATAVAYAIVSETQDLKREATRADHEALQRVLPRARLTDLGRIRHPARSRAYYETIARALREVRLGRNVCVCHIGAVPVAEVVAEVADLLKSMERITWCLVTGWHEGAAVVSLRAAHPHARAERVLRAVLGHAGRGGGHGMIAGGTHPCPDSGRYTELADAMTERLLRRTQPGARSPLHPLLEPDASCASLATDAEELVVV